MAIESETVGLLAFEGPFVLAGIVGAWKCRTLRTDTYNRLAAPTHATVTALESEAFDGLVRLQDVLNRDLTTGDERNPERFGEYILGYSRPIAAKYSLQRNFKWALRSCSTLFFALIATIIGAVVLMLRQVEIVAIPTLALWVVVVVGGGALVVVSFSAMYLFEAKMRPALEKMEPPST